MWVMPRATGEQLLGGCPLVPASDPAELLLSA